MNKTKGTFLALIASLLLFAPNVFSTTHIIQFGGTFGNTYSPSTLQVQVGDVIEWQGNFTFHPLSSTTIPAGAEAFSAASGTVLDYTVTVAGDYNYRCDVHFSIGMTGSFNAEPATSVGRQISNNPAEFNLEQNYPNPFNPETKFRFSLEKSDLVTLTVFNILGKEMAVLVNEVKPAGIYELRFNAADFQLPSGIYIYQLKSGINLATKKFTLLK